MKCRSEIDINTICYVAGLFDGEGSIVIGVSKPSFKRDNKVPCHWLQVGITNTNRELIDWLYNTFGGHISDNSHAPSRKFQRACWQWRVMSIEGVFFLKLIQPYTKIKKRQIELAKEFQDNLVNLRSLTPDLKSKEIERRQSLKEAISALTLGKHSLSN